MKASEFIDYIQKQIKLHGDLDITAYGCNDQYSFDNPEFRLSTEVIGPNAKPFYIIEPKPYGVELRFGTKRPKLDRI